MANFLQITLLKTILSLILLYLDIEKYYDTTELVYFFCCLNFSIIKHHQHHHLLAKKELYFLTFSKLWALILLHLKIPYLNLHFLSKHLAYNKYEAIFKLQGILTWYEVHNASLFYFLKLSSAFTLD